jgi:RNA polymerase sigma-70 factor (ECF subfamily)
VDDRGTDERELVRRCRDGSEAAYAELVRLHRPRLYNLAFRLVGDRETAEDVLQETFLAAFKAIDRFEPKPSLAPWLNTIAVRIAKRAAERGRARPNASLDRLTAADDPFTAVLQPIELDPAADPQAAAEAAELRREVDSVIEGLPFSYRTAVVLRFVMGLDYAAAAQTMNVPLNTYKSHLLRGTKLLRTGLARQLEPPGESGARLAELTATDAEPTEPATPVVDVGENGHDAELDTELMRARAAAGRPAGISIETARTLGAVGLAIESPTGQVALEPAAIPRHASGLES